MVACHLMRHVVHRARVQVVVGRRNQQRSGFMDVGVMVFNLFRWWWRRGQATATVISHAVPDVCLKVLHTAISPAKFLNG